MTKLKISYDQSILDDFGQFIYQKRKELNKTQQQVARSSVISQTRLSLLEQGKAAATIVEIKHILVSLSHSFIIMNNNEKILWEAFCNKIDENENDLYAEMSAEQKRIFMEMEEI